jgi:hypothetical protein
LFSVELRGSLVVFFLLLLLLLLLLKRGDVGNCKNENESIQNSEADVAIFIILLCSRIILIFILVVALAFLPLFLKRSFLLALTSRTLFFGGKMNGTPSKNPLL